MKSKFLRGVTKVFGSIILILLAVVLYLRLFAGRVTQRLDSPDGNAVAEVRFYNYGFATDAPEIALQMRTKYNPFRHTVFFALTYGGDVTISWTDALSLSVSCSRCNDLGVYAREVTWRDVSIRYANDLPEITGQQAERSGSRPSEQVARTP